MGGTFKEMIFSDRDSDYPSRRKLIKISEQENIYDVSRAEGTVRNEGTPFNAKTLNDFQDNISSMFPVTVTNGGTGATTAQQARTNLGIPITYGTLNSSNFGIYSGADTSSSIPLSSGTVDVRYYKIANLVHCSIRLSSLIARTVPIEGALAIGGLPYYNSSTLSSASVGRFSISNIQNINARAYLPANSRYIYVVRGDGDTALPVRWWKNASDSRTLNAFLSVTYSLV